MLQCGGVVAAKPLTQARRRTGATDLDTVAEAANAVAAGAPAAAEVVTVMSRRIWHK